MKIRLNSEEKCKLYGITVLSVLTVCEYCYGETFFSLYMITTLPPELTFCCNQIQTLQGYLNTLYQSVLFLLN